MCVVLLLYIILLWLNIISSCDTLVLNDSPVAQANFSTATNAERL